MWITTGQIWGHNCTFAPKSELAQEASDADDDLAADPTLVQAGDGRRGFREGINLVDGRLHAARLDQRSHGLKIPVILR